MKFRIRFAEQIVGIFVLVAAVMLVGTIVSMGANQRWFVRNYNYYSVFPSASGLSVGMPIQYKGFDIGRITEITLTETDDVRVDFLIRETFHDRVRPDSILELVGNPLGLGGGLVFHRGTGGTEPIEEGGLIPLISSEQGQAIVAREGAVVPESGDAISRIINQVEPVLRNVNSLLISTDETLGFVNAALDGGVDRPLGLTLAQVNTLLAEVERTLVETRAQGNEILGSVAVIADDFTETSASLRDPTGLVPRLLDADGSIETLLNDNNRLYLQIERMLIQLNDSLTELNRFAGFVNGTQPQLTGLIEEGQQAIIAGQDVLEGLSNNPLIRGGITAERVQATTFRSYRDAQF